MAKRPVAKVKAGAAKRPRGPTPVVLEAAPAHWGRSPTPAPEEVLEEALRFMLVDIDDGPISAKGAGHELRLCGVTAGGASVCLKVIGMHPYFYARCTSSVIGREDEVRAALEASLVAASANKGGDSIVSVETVHRTPLFGFQPEAEVLKIVYAGPRVLTPCLRALEQGVKLLATAAGDEVELQSGTFFETNISLVMRFLVDFDFGGGRWLEVPSGALRISGGLSLAQLNFEICLDASCAAGAPFSSSSSPSSPSLLRGLPLDSELGSSLPPLRIAAVEVLTDSKGLLRASAAALQVTGESSHHRAVWLLRETEAVPRRSTPGDATAASAEEWADVVVEEYDTSSPESTQLFACADEDALVEHLGRTLEAFDADIILSYDLVAMARGLFGNKGLAKVGSGVACGLSRRATADLKLTPKSNEIAGLFGRLGFDLQKQVEKEHRLSDYSLASMSQSFCGHSLPELREATLASLYEQRPRVFAQHALEKAEASLRVFDELSLLFNLVEMSRVTGCPIAYLLERGQAVKVQFQLLREAGRRGFIQPPKPKFQEEMTFEGATVLDPVTGFHKFPVAVLDFASLYPSIMMAQNLCYSTLLPKGRDGPGDDLAHHTSPKPTTAGDGDPGVASCFVDASVRRGLLPCILEQLLAARRTARAQLAECHPEQVTRRKVLHGRQLALKLSANSVYGFTGAVNGPLPCLELAGAVTSYGREMIMSTRRIVEAHFQRKNGYDHDAKVLYGDTDSVMVSFGPAGSLTVDDAKRLSHEASKLCSQEFPPPVRLEFEKVYRPFLLMNKKRYAGLAWTMGSDPPKVETKGIETVRRDWCDLVRQGMEQTLHFLFRQDGEDGSEEAIAYVRQLCDELRQNKVDFRSLVISKSLGREEYATKAPHVELAEKLRKRDPRNAPALGDRVSYLVLAGAAKSKLYERAEDPMYALEHDLPVDAEYYLENQLQQPLIRIFEHVLGDASKAELALFGLGKGQQRVVVAAAPSRGGLGKFVKARPKCLICTSAVVSGDGEAFCAPCATLDASKLDEVRETYRRKAIQLRTESDEFKAHCDTNCALVPGNFPALPPDHEPLEGAVCPSMSCKVVFRRARVAKELKTLRETLARLKVSEW